MSDSKPSIGTDFDEAENENLYLYRQNQYLQPEPVTIIGSRINLKILSLAEISGPILSFKRIYKRHKGFAQPHDNKARKQRKSKNIPDKKAYARL